MALTRYGELRNQLMRDPDYVEGVLQKGAARARAEAQKTMALVREAVGLARTPTHK